MNDRIKQISNEVWEWSDSQEYKGVDEFSEIWEAEFARRIVQECAGVISDRIGPKSDRWAGSLLCVVRPFASN